MQDKVSVMLVPVRETVSVPMPHQEARQDNTRLYVLAAVGILLALAAGGLGTAAFLRRRRSQADSQATEE